MTSEWEILQDLSVDDMYVICGTLTGDTQTARRPNRQLCIKPTGFLVKLYFLLIYLAYDEFDCQYSEGHTFSHGWFWCEYLICADGRITTLQCPSGKGYDGGYNSTSNEPCGWKTSSCDVSTAGYEQWEHVLS